MACTVKNFPYYIEHTIQWSREYFEEILVQHVNEIIDFIENPKAYVEKFKAELAAAA